MRMAPNRIPIVALHWTPPGKRKKVRARTTWRRTITSELEEIGFFLWARLSTLQRTEGDGDKLLMPYVPSGMKRISK